MKKYLILIRNSFSEYFAYRLNFFLWRVRVIAIILINFSLWQAIFRQNKVVFGYDESQILTYIIFISILSGIVLATRTERVATEINMGILSNLLIKPIHYFFYNLSRDLADKVINTCCSFIEIALLITVINPPVILQNNPFWLLSFIMTSIVASLLYFEINMLLSSVAFWSKETWAPRFIFFILVNFLAGMYFPLDIVPQGLYRILEYLPFTYLIFFPLKIYLGNITIVFLIKGLIISVVWSVFLWWLMIYVWKKGLKIYTSEGQ